MAYADMIKEKLGPAVLEVYLDGSGVFQDDGATIHSAEVSLRAVEETFTSQSRPHNPSTKNGQCMANRKWLEYF